MIGKGQGDGSVVPPQRNRINHPDELDFATAILYNASTERLLCVQCGTHRMSLCAHIEKRQEKREPSPCPRIIEVMIVVITRDKEYKLKFFVYTFAFVGILFVFAFGLGAPIGFALLINSPALLLIALDLISSGRTIVMDESGCTVHFWIFQKKYKWEQLKTKRIEKYTSPPMFNGLFRCYYLTEAMFCPHKARKPKFIRPSTYVILHPFSCIYVNMHPSVGIWQRGRSYEVDETVFYEKMNQWGINLEER